MTNETMIGERMRLYDAALAAEKVFEAAYKADPNRRGMRPGDFRYHSGLHSPATREAADAFVKACDAWRVQTRAVQDAA